jgi:glucan phosphoethanolaminetransferase (alkaline phosphatase superfamily)
MQKISTIVLYILAAVSVVFAVLFFVGGNVSDATGTETAEPTFTALNLTWAYLLFFGAVAITLLFSIAHIFTHPAALKSTLISVGVGVVLVAIAYLLASDAPVGGRNAELTTAATLKWVGAGMYTMYILGGLAIIGVVVSEIYNAFN